jgi:hypothetical protein
VARYKGQEHAAEVIETENGIRYRLEDGQEFSSPSSAGSTVMGGKACNGWRFWSLTCGEEASAPKSPPKRPGKKNASSTFQRLEDGRYFCSACMEAFEAPKGVEPHGCPQGHKPEGSEASS